MQVSAKRNVSHGEEQDVEVRTERTKQKRRRDHIRVVVEEEEERGSETRLHSVISYWRRKARLHEGCGKR